MTRGLNIFNNIPRSPKLFLQYQMFIEGKSPTIASEQIKQIPIKECYEPLVNVNTQMNPRIRMMKDPMDGKIFADMDCNSGTKDASKIRLSLYSTLEYMLKRLDRNAPEFGYEQGQFTIKVFEGLRSIKLQEELFEQKKTEIIKSNPGLLDEQLDIETAKWVSPVKNNVPVHSTGAAVDIRIWDNKNDRYLNMGKFGALGGNPDAPTFSDNISAEQARNREYLLISAHEAKLTNYSYEWWHYSIDDRYACYWDETKTARYGSIDFKPKL